MIHHVGDGLPPRVVFVDGRQVECVTYADVERGLVRHNLSPARINPRHDGVRWAKKRGNVEVYALIDPVVAPIRTDAPSYFEWVSARG